MNTQSQYLAGMTGGTGGTGASGGTGDIGSTNSENHFYNDPNQSIEQFAMEYAYQGLVGATGGKGAIPQTVEEARRQGITMSTMRDKLIDIIKTMENPDEIIAKLKIKNKEFQVVEGKANSQVAYCALNMGLYLLKLQAIRIQLNKRDWVEWSEKNVNFISKRSREKYMNIAGLPGAERHLAYGVELLSEIGSVYSLLNEEEAATLGLDAIETLLKKSNFNDGTSYEERKLHLDSVVQVKKLERNHVFIPLQLMTRFLRRYKPFTSEERRFLREIGKVDKQAPKRHLEEFIVQSRDRKDFITKSCEEIDLSSSTDRAHVREIDNDSLKNIKIPNIDVQVATLSQSFDRYLVQGEGLPAKVDIEALEHLAQKALELVKKAKESSLDNTQ